MQFMLIMNTPRDGYTQYLNWPKKVLEANIAFMEAFSKKLKDAGELVGGEGLASPWSGGAATSLHLKTPCRKP